MSTTGPGTATRAAAWAKGAVLLTALCAAAAGGAPDGHLPVRIEISNAAGAPLQCQALAAHWYSFPVVRVEPDRIVTFSFAIGPAPGEVVDPASTLPVETVYCGWAGAAWATRAAIDLRPVAAGGTERIACRAAGSRLACTR